MDWYILDDDGNPVKATTEEVSVWICEHGHESRLALTKVDTFRVSTVFLAFDANRTGQGPPMVFETMAFLDGEPLSVQRRYATKAEALEGHEEIVKSLSKVDDLAKRVLDDTIARYQKGAND